MQTIYTPWTSRITLPINSLQFGRILHRCLSALLIMSLCVCVHQHAFIFRICIFIDFSQFLARWWWWLGEKIVSMQFVYFEISSKNQFVFNFGFICQFLQNSYVSKCVLAIEEIDKTDYRYQSNSSEANYISK